jgi:hypothetical protein
LGSSFAVTAGMTVLSPISPGAGIQAGAVA